MCNPAAIVYGVMAMTTVYQQSEQSRMQNAMYEQNQDNAIRAQLDQYDSQAADANQRREVAGQQASRNALEAARARATASVAATESGLSGLSIDALISDIDRQEGTNYSDIAANEAFAADSRMREAKGIRSQAQSRINSVSPGGFNPIVGLLQIGTQAGMGYYSGTK